MTQIDKCLRKKDTELGIKEIYLNIKYVGNVFPNIKLELESRFNNRKIDITIFQKKNNGQKYVEFILSKLAQYEHIKPVFFCLQRLLFSFNLHNPAKNGLKTYTIFLMILLMAENMRLGSPAELFINTVYYYA